MKIKIDDTSFLGRGRIQGSARPFEILSREVFPGSCDNIEWVYPEHDGHLPTSMMVHVVHGRMAGPVLCLTAAIHGDELNGIAIIRRIIDGLDHDRLRGTVIGIPVVNLDGFNHHVRYIEDDVDLNRCFPGAVEGVYAERVAHGIFNDIIVHSDALLDLHTGSSLRENLVQLRADLTNTDIARFSTGFGDFNVIQSHPRKGTLRHAVTEHGIPAVVMEVGRSQGVEIDKVELGVMGITTLLSSAGMLGEENFTPVKQHIFLGSGWVRAEFGGILVHYAELGEQVREDQLLAEIIDPFSSTVHTVFAPFECTILGRAHSQYVEPGFALFRVAMESP